MPKPLVSVIVLNYNGKRFLKDCFESLKLQSYPNYEVIFVDNASSDGSTQYVKENFPEVSIIENDENLGAAEGKNVGMRYALSKGAQYIALLDNDTTVQPEWLDELVKGVESDPNVGFCTSKILWMKDPSICLGCGLLIDVFGFPCAPNTELFQHNEIREVFHAIGAGMLIRREVLEMTGYFDKEIFFGAEEIDLCWRAQLMGYKVVANPKSVLYHYWGGGMPGEITISKRGRLTYPSETKYFVERNILRTVIKNYSATSLIWVLPGHIGLMAAEALFFTFVSPRFSWLYLKAILWNLRHLGDTLRLRREVQKMRRVSDRELRKNTYKGIGKIRVLKQLGVPKYVGKH